jgi:hypothetical protein
MDAEYAGISDFAEIELSSQAWRREARVRGRFASSPGSAEARKVLKRSKASQTAHDSAAATLAKHEAILQQHQQQMQQMNTKHTADVSSLVGQVKDANQRLAATVSQAESEEKHKARIKIAVHAGTLTGGAILAAIEAKMGTPGLVQIASALGPQAIQEIADWAKRL